MGTSFSIIITVFRGKPYCPKWNTGSIDGEKALQRPVIDRNGGIVTYATDLGVCCRKGKVAESVVPIQGPLRSSAGTQELLDSLLAEYTKILTPLDFAILSFRSMKINYGNGERWPTSGSAMPSLSIATLSGNAELRKLKIEHKHSKPRGGRVELDYSRRDSGMLNFSHHLTRLN